MKIGSRLLGQVVEQALGTDQARHLHDDSPMIRPEETWGSLALPDLNFKVRTTKLELECRCSPALCSGLEVTTVLLFQHYGQFQITLKRFSRFCANNLFSALTSMR